MPEEWQPVVGYEGLYSVSNHGRVRSEERIVVMSGLYTGRQVPCRERILRSAPHAKGHHQVVLYRNGIGTTHKVHILVLEAFVGPRPAGLQGLHWDDVPDNNMLSNLRWGTPSENMSDRIRNGKHFGTNKTHCKRQHEFTTENTYWKATKTGVQRVCRKCAAARARETRAERIHR